MRRGTAVERGLLQSDDEAFRWIIEQLEDSVTVLAEDGAVLYTSPAVARTTGYSFEELAALDVFALVHDDDAGEVRALFDAAVAEPGRRVAAQYRFRHKDGSWRWLRSTGSYLVGGPAGSAFLVVSQDITERRIAEDAQSLLAAIVSSSDDAIVTVTPEGIITSWNAGAERTFGYAAAEVVGAHAIGMIPSELRERVMANVARVVAGDVLREIEEERLHKDGTRVPLSMTVFPLRGRDGAILGIGTIARDLRERRLAEQVVAAQATTRRHVRRILHDLAHAGHVPPQVMRNLGRRLAAEVHGDAMDAYVWAFHAMGFGRLEVRDGNGDGRYVVEGRDLLELSPAAAQPTCHLALGFLESAAGIIGGGAGLGAEMECQSMGDARCVFMLRARPAPGRQ